MTRRVVITGLGAVCPVGNDMPTVWRNLVAGETGVGYITRFDASAFKVPLSAEINDFDPEEFIAPKALKHMDRNVQYAVVSAREALTDAGLEITDDNRHRVGVIVGSGGGGLETVLKWYDVLTVMKNGGVHVVQVDRVFDGMKSEIVRGSVGNAPFHTSASQPTTVALLLVLAAVSLERLSIRKILAPWRTTEFSRPEYERLV